MIDLASLSTNPQYAAMTPQERHELCHQRRMDREELRQIRRVNKLLRRSIGYMVGKTSAVSKIITCVAVAVYIVTIACGIHLMYYFADTSGIYALFGSVAAPAGAAIFVFINKNTKENTEGGITYEATMHNLDHSNPIDDENMAD